MPTQHFFTIYSAWGTNVAQFASSSHRLCVDSGLPPSPQKMVRYTSRQRCAANRLKMLDKAKALRDAAQEKVSVLNPLFTRLETARKQREKSLKALKLIREFAAQVTNPTQARELLQKENQMYRRTVAAKREVDSLRRQMQTQRLQAENLQAQAQGCMDAATTLLQNMPGDDDVIEDSPDAIDLPNASANADDDGFVDDTEFAKKLCGLEIS